MSDIDDRIAAIFGATKPQVSSIDDRIAKLMGGQSDSLKAAENKARTGTLMSILAGRDLNFDEGRKFMAQREPEPKTPIEKGTEGVLGALGATTKSVMEHPFSLYHMLAGAVKNYKEGQEATPYDKHQDTGQIGFGERIMGGLFPPMIAGNFALGAGEEISAGPTAYLRAHPEEDDKKARAKGLLQGLLSAPARGAETALTGLATAFTPSGPTEGSLTFGRPKASLAGWLGGPSPDRPWYLGGGDERPNVEQIMGEISPNPQVQAGFRLAAGIIPGMVGGAATNLFRSFNKGGPVGPSVLTLDASDLAATAEPVFSTSTKGKLTVDPIAANLTGESTNTSSPGKAGTKFTGPELTPGTTGVKPPAPKPPNLDTSFRPEPAWKWNLDEGELVPETPIKTAGEFKPREPQIPMRNPKFPGEFPVERPGSKGKAPMPGEIVPPKLRGIKITLPSGDVAHVGLSEALSALLPEGIRNPTRLPAGLGGLAWDSSPRAHAIRIELAKQGISTLAEAAKALMKSNPGLGQYQAESLARRVLLSTPGGMVTPTTVKTGGVLSVAKAMKEGGEDLVAQVLNLPRALKSSGDMSAPLRQGLVLSINHPVKAAWAGRDMAKAFFSEKYFMKIDDIITSDPIFKLRKEVGSYHAPKDGPPTLKEEAFQSQLAENIPGYGRVVKASNRAFNTYLNKLRHDVFKSSAEKFGFDPIVDKVKLEGLAEYINVTTGRGDLGSLERSAARLNGVFFSPRNMKAKIDLINPLWYKRLPKEVRNMAMREVATALGAGLGVISLAKLAGIKVETDPTSADFGKIRVGNARFDIWGGHQQNVSFLAKMWYNQRKDADGNIINFGPDKAFGSTRLSEAFRFAQSKAAPIPGAIMDWMRGEDFNGDPLDKKWAFRQVAPMFAADFYDVVSQEGLGATAALAAPFGFFGGGITAYQAGSPLSKIEHAARKGEDVTQQIDQGVARGLFNENQVGEMYSRLEKEETEARLSQLDVKDLISTLATMPQAEQEKYAPLLEIKKLRKDKSELDAKKRDGRINMEEYNKLIEIKYKLKALNQELDENLMSDE